MCVLFAFAKCAGVFHVLLGGAVHANLLEHLRISAAANGDDAHNVPGACEGDMGLV